MTILCNLEYYTEDLLHYIITHLPDFSQTICKQALTYLSAAPFIPKTERASFSSYLHTVIEDEHVDGILRNQAFETLYNIYDLLVEGESPGE